MFERFTRQARTVVQEARRQAVQATASEIRPEHLLVAILDGQTTLATRVLAALGAEPDRLRTAVDRERGRYVDGLDQDDAEALAAIGIDLDEVVRRIDRNLGPLRGSGRGRIPFAHASKKTLELALREAVRMGHNYIGTEHILLGLADSGDRLVADTFAQLGLSLSAMRDAVAEAVRSAS